MKLYKREIKPMVDHTFFYREKWDLIPVTGFDNWYPEEKKEELNKAITISDPCAVLVFEERFVEVKTSKWLLMMDDEVMSLIPMYKCSICGNSFSGYYPPEVCEHCGAKMVSED